MQQNPSIIKTPSEKPDKEGLVKALSQDELAAFISVPYAVIKAGRGVTPASFSFAITLRLGIFHVPTVRLGVVDLSAIEWTPAVRLYTLLNMERLGLKPDSQGAPPSGYYLFAGGLPIEFHEGKSDSTKDEEARKMSLWLGLFGHLAQSNEFNRISKQIGKWPVGERVSEAFAKTILKHAKSSAGAPGAPPPSPGSSEEPVRRRAYDTLRLSPSASTAEVIAAHERLLRELSLNQLSREEHLRQAARLKAARDFILNPHGEDIAEQ
ncbi:hypothetical protein JQX13_08010 [Archangium violaceum]|uniref:hypothetical protein n=1 Tax=Archangium violaceum TaxID=83451 RepID=UPI00193C392A|nr:hypothetical protein [Archangium violaceum]QRK10031.1 hypothetical protein JQX13_08010 [Archangium violaceum]